MNNLEQNDYEAAAEKEAMMKAMHQPMKKWFFRQPSTFTSKFGAFPLFWQDFKTWEHFLEVKRHYLKSQEDADYVPTHTPTPAPAPSKSATSEGAAPTEEATAIPAEATPADATPTDTVPAVNANGLTKEEEEKKAKKRKTRWGSETPATEEQKDDGKKKKRKSRWSTDTPAVGPGAMTVAGASLSAGGLTLTPQAQQMLVLRMKLQEIEQKILTVVLDAKRLEEDPNRPPSPPPIYDANGKRVNTREVVMRQEYQAKRLEIIEEMVKVNPAFKPPMDYIKSKLNRKIYIPSQKDHPDVNFIGLIIGPRGNTQKKMERDTSCKIAIRGRGSVKEGSKKQKQPPEPDANEDLHVLIQGEREEDVERAAKMINELLDVDNKDKVEEHKAAQLKQLAIINGTLREEDFCHNCGERGHKSWECPKRVDTYEMANVKCEICGDSSHITADCPLRAKPTQQQQAHLDKEYMSFLEELGEGPAGGPPKPKPTSEPAESTTPAPAPAPAPLPPPQFNQPPPPHPYGGFPPPMPGHYGHPPPPMPLPGHMPPWGQQQWHPPPGNYGYPPPPMPGGPPMQQPWGGGYPPPGNMPPGSMPPGMPPGSMPPPPQPGGGQYSAVPPPQASDNNSSQNKYGAVPPPGQLPQGIASLILKFSLALLLFTAF